MRCFAGACRFVFNHTLALQNENHEAQIHSYTKMSSWLVEWKTASDTQWLKDLERAYKNFFQKRATFPRFKSEAE